MEGSADGEKGGGILGCTLCQGGGGAKKEMGRHRESRRDRQTDSKRGRHRERGRNSQTDSEIGRHNREEGRHDRQEGRHGRKEGRQTVK